MGEKNGGKSLCCQGQMLWLRGTEGKNKNNIKYPGFVPQPGKKLILPISDGYKLVSC
jgi:hypothetical protein